MPGFSYVLVLLLAMIGSAASSLATSYASNQQVKEEVSAASVRVMAGIARAYVAANPAKSGEVSAAELAPYTPAWFRGDAQVRVAASGGRAYIFIVPTTEGRTSTQSVMTGDEMPVTLGIAMSGRLVSPVAGTVLLDLPSVIPEGALVYVV